MKRLLAPLLVCPACLPKELPLELSAEREADGDVLAGHLSCRGCRKRFPIREGIARLVPDPDAGPAGGQWRYEEAATVNGYLWSHYGDILGVEEGNGAYAEWSAQLAPVAGLSLDAGCSVGRLTFELAALSELAIGCDLSLPFVRSARRLARDRETVFSLPLEGEIREEFPLRLPERLPSGRVEFIVADALRLPFPRELFAQTLSMNILDRVRYPLAHLYEMSRVSGARDSRFLFSSPFSWTVSSTPEERWLGGRKEGKHTGRGIDNVRRLLQGEEGILSPPWKIAGEGCVRWRFRYHANHAEEIRSMFLLAKR